MESSHLKLEIAVLMNFNIGIAPVITRLNTNTQSSSRNPRQLNKMIIEAEQEVLMCMVVCFGLFSLK